MNRYSLFVIRNTILLLLMCFIINFPVNAETQKEKLYKAYKQTVKYYNPKLNDKTINNIVSSVIYYSWKYQLDPRFVMAVVAVESSFHPQAVSSAGAMGLGQIMPENLRALGITEPFEPIANIGATVRILKLNLDRFKHLPYRQQIINAIAAYNAGYGAVLKYGGIPPYKETQNYVRKVIGLWRKFCGLK